MPNETVELLFKFVNQGSEQLDRAAGSVDKVVNGSGKATPHLQGLERQLGGTGKEADKTSRSLDGLADKIRNGLSSPVQTATGSLEGFLGKFGKIGAITTAVAVGVGIVGKQIYDLVSELGAAAEQSINFADRLGIAIGRAEQLQAQAQIAGVNIGSLEGAVRILSAALEDPAGAGAKTVAALRDLGVATSEASGQQRELGAVLLDVLGALSRIESNSERVATMQRVLGRGASTELIPLVKNLNELQAAVERVGVGMNPDLTEKLAKADDKFGELKKRIEEIKRELAEPLVSPLISLLDRLMWRPSMEAPTRRPWGVEGQEKLSYQSPIRVITPEQALEDRYRQSRENTPEGQRWRIQELQRQVAEKEAIIYGKGANLDAKAGAVRDAERLLAEIRQIEARLAQKPGEGDLKLEDLLARASPRKRSFPPSLYKPGEVLQIDSKDLVGQTDEERERAALKAYGDGLLEIEKLRADVRKRTNEAEVNAAIRLLELSDNEYEAALRIRDIKLATAKDAAEARQAELDYTVRIEEIEKQRLERYKETAGRVWDAMRSDGRGGGLRDMLRGQLDILQRQIFVNASAGIFQRVGGVLGQIGAASGLGGLLEGTIFDPKNAQKPLDQNTKSLDRLRTSVDKLTSRIGAVSPVGSPLPTSIPGLDTGLVIDESGAFGGGGGFLSKIPGLGKIFGGRTGKSVGSFFGGAGSIFSAGLFSGFRGGDYSVALGDGKAVTASSLGLTSTAGRIGNIVGSGALVGLGALGMISGLREGGAGGAVTAIGSALGVASAIPGPQQPFLQAAALVAGFVKGLLPNPKEEFDQAQADTLNARRYTGPEAQSRNYDIVTGGDVDQDWRGRIRVVVQRTVQLSVSALDAQSIIDRKEDLATAVHKAIDAGHPLGNGIQQVIFGVA